MLSDDVKTFQCDTNINANIYMVYQGIPEDEDEELYLEILRNYVDSVIRLRDGVRNQLRNLSKNNAYVIATEEMKGSLDINQLQTVVKNGR